MLSQVSIFCTPAEARTLDTLIKSQVLYQLSYKRITKLALEGPSLRISLVSGCKGREFLRN